VPDGKLAAGQTAHQPPHRSSSTTTTPSHPRRLWPSSLSLPLAHLSPSSPAKFRGRHTAGNYHYPTVGGDLAAVPLTTNHPSPSTPPFLTTMVAYHRRQPYPPVFHHHPAGGAITARPRCQHPATTVGPTAAVGHPSRHQLWKLPPNTKPRSPRNNNSTSLHHHPRPTAARHRPPRPHAIFFDFRQASHRGRDVVTFCY
jgi:hypothetical protein